MRKNHMAVWVIVLSLGVCFGAVLNAQDDPEVGPNVGNLAPDFTLMNLNPLDETEEEAVEFTLSDHAGKVVVMTFWGWTCISCKEEEMPALQHEVWDVFPQEQVMVLAVNQDVDPNLDNIREYMADKQITYPMLVDGLRTAVDYQVFATPILIIVDHEGVIRFKEGNRLFDDEVKAFIEDLVAELPEPGNEEGM
jgi:thiol-disulfide isomerase/thioredoxin